MQLFQPLRISNKSREIKALTNFSATFNLVIFEGIVSHYSCLFIPIRKIQHQTVNCTRQHFSASQNSFLYILWHSRLLRYKLLKYKGMIFAKALLLKTIKLIYKNLMTAIHRLRSSKHKYHLTSSTGTLTLLRSINKF